MKTKILLLTALFLNLLSFSNLTGLNGLQAANYYIATDGSDTNTGTITSPFATLNKAQSLVVAGDTVYFRGGTYQIAQSQVMEYSGIFARVFKLDKSGTAQRRICYFGYPGEQPVFDLSAVKPANYRVYVFFVSGSYLHFKNFEVVGTQVTILDHTQSECFHHEGGNNCIYENLAMHDGMAIGFYITRGSNNLVLNCDAYNNWDNVSEDKKGGNVDGFGGHLNSENYPGNVFRGCRAWYNSDDGYDLISNKSVVTIENCWSWKNGYSTAGASLGNGAGFKSGGYGMNDSPSVPSVIPRNIVRFCLAVDNKAQGFYANHHLGGIDFYNNTAYRNPTNYNMVNRQISPLTPATDVGGYNHNIKNNVSYSPRTASSHITQINTTSSVVQNNTWQLASTASLSASDFVFVSTDLTQLAAPRQADGSLPDIDFLKPSATSRLIDKGQDIGFAFEGAAPDLGYREYRAPNAVENIMQNEKDVKTVEYYNITGQRTTPRTKGLIIARTVFTDNSAESRVVLNAWD
ncbi:MAG: right-handed parallel beta-helix repeat-containing protein [Paludibacter sp.]|jgi:parallel beta-helix repeat protein|nr:right-handed parallel beta-helix repeat-containing protein [Paludibacter sp.]